MSAEDIARIDVTMKNLVELTREQNESINKMVVTLTEMRVLQVADSKRIDKLEADKVWVVRLIIGGLITAAMIAFKAG